jgi:Tfp pilus assembly protein PilV
MMKSMVGNKPGPMRARRASARGFTLAELLIAMMAGLFIAIAAFSFSKQATRAFAQEARIASAQMSVLAGFQKLQSEVARSAYMASPNFARDAGFNRICGYNDTTYFPAFLAASQLTGLKVTVQGSQSAPGVTKVPNPSGSFPDAVRIVGNLSTVEAFTVLAIMKGSGAGHDIYIHSNNGPSSRAGFYGTDGGQFTSVFQVGRMLRIVDKQNRQHYGIVDAATWNTGQPYISTRLPLSLKGEGANPLCSIDGIGTDTQVNIVNIVDYGIANIKGKNASYDNTIYSAGASTLGDDSRTELVRREWLIGTADPVPFYQDATSTMVVAEYAFDLRLSLWTSNKNASGCTKATGDKGLLQCDYSSAAITTLMTVAATYYPGDPAVGPESVRAVQIRLATRSREIDRTEDLAPLSPAPPLTNGAVFRHKVGTYGYARARTLVADVSLQNQRGDAW